MKNDTWDYGAMALFFSVLLSMVLFIGVVFWYAERHAPKKPFSCDQCPAAPPCPAEKACPPCPKPPAPAPAPAISEQWPNCEGGWAKEVRAFKCVPYTTEELNIKRWVKEKKGEK